MHAQSYGSRSVCLCLSVCYRASSHLSGLYGQGKLLIFLAACRLLQIQCMYCVEFAENISFGRYGITYLPQRWATRLFLDGKHNVIDGS